MRPYDPAEIESLPVHERHFIRFMTCKKYITLWAQDSQQKNEWISHLRKYCLLTDFSTFYKNIK